jgi:hypothetical protein
MQFHIPISTLRTRRKPAFSSFFQTLLLLFLLFLLSPLLMSCWNTTTGEFPARKKDLQACHQCVLQMA